MKIKRMPNLTGNPHHPTRVEIGSSIKKYRKQCGLSQQELAKEVGLESATAMSLIESGDRRLDTMILVKASYVLNVPVWFILYGELKPIGVKAVKT